MVGAIVAPWRCRRSGWWPTTTRAARTRAICTVTAGAAKPAGDSRPGPRRSALPMARRMVRGVRSASGKTFETRNPATGDVLATVAEGDREEIDRATSVARAAFEGPWSKFKPYERQALLLKIADIALEQDCPRLATRRRPVKGRRVFFSPN